VTASISRLQAEKTAPVRHTKLAYINSDAKPPREVRRRQMKHRNEMLHSPTVNGKRKVDVAAAAVSSVTDVMPSPKKRHSAPGACVLPGACSFPGRAESSPQSKGLCVLFKRLAISDLRMLLISISMWPQITCCSQP